MRLPEERMVDGRLLQRAGRWCLSLLITLLLWAYFTVGFVLLFSPFYLWAALFTTDRTGGFRQLNSRFYQGFFSLARRLMPAWRWQIDPRVRRLRGSLIVCNHVSYIDSILLISLFTNHTTIAKARLFAIPLFGQMLKASGYLPSSAAGDLTGLMVDCMERLPAELAAGTSLIVFPEGTRSRDGRIGEFHSSVFKIARRLGRPIQVLAITGSENLFRPGRFVFNALVEGIITVDWIGEVAPPAADGGKGALGDTIGATRRLLETHLQAAAERLSRHSERIRI